jgi:hypothetical protein
MSKRDELELEIERTERDLHQQQATRLGRRVTIREKKAEIARLEADEATTLAAIEKLQTRKDALELEQPPPKRHRKRKPPTRP